MVNCCGSILLGAPMVRARARAVAGTAMKNILIGALVWAVLLPMALLLGWLIATYPVAFITGVGAGAAVWLFWLTGATLTDHEDY